MDTSQIQTTNVSTVNNRTGLKSRNKVFKVLRTYPMILVGGLMVFTLLLIAIFAPLIATHNPITQYPTGISDIGAPKGPNSEFIFGADSIGRDVFSRVIYGTRVSLEVGIFASLISLFIGVTLGVVSGYFGKWVDMVIMRITDTMLAFPFLLFVIALVAVLKPSITNVFIAIGVLGWAMMTRIVRGEVLKVKELEYVQSAKALGASNFVIIFKEILPNVVAPVIVMGTLLVGQNIMLEAALSFLGIGIQPPTASWGNMLQDGMNTYQIAPWLIYLPGFALLWATLGFNLLGDGLRDWLDPTVGN
ncbi:ABC transporter permease [Neobacillus novalis]|uniref:ABC transporter permease n=1 Tax=Neobacillus novalis TaxID=220687 RepID=A0AA95MSL9_9BACI|nr:ABC transporter permease [Neobacillus novalis]WHY86586.1 ABC transporter permease [Neobacillus novalis]